MLILAFSTDLSLESCRRPTADEVRMTTQDMLTPDESPAQYAEYAKNDAQRSTRYISDEATQAKDELVDHGRNIGTEAVNGTVRTTSNAAKSYFGFIGNLFAGVKRDWAELKKLIGYTDEDARRVRESMTYDYLEEYDREKDQRVRDAWENANPGDDTYSKNTINEDITTENTQLPNASDSVKKKIYRLPDNGYTGKAGWINC